MFSRHSAIMAVAFGVLTVTCDDPSGARNSISACNANGTEHRGVITTETWVACANPHVLADTVTVTGKLTIEAGAIINAPPHALLRVPQGGQLAVLGRENQRVHFVALDTVTGWKGIQAGHASELGGLVVIKYADISYANAVSGGSSSRLTLEHVRLRRTSVGAAANFAAFDIRHSEVDDATVLLAHGTFEETVIRRGSLALVAAQPGSGDVTLNGGRIEDSPGEALTIGSINLLRAPRIGVVKAPEIVAARGGIGTMPVAAFLALWPTVADQSNLINNINKRIAVWGPSFGNLNLSRGFDWRLYGVVGQTHMASLSLEPGATVYVGGHFIVDGPFRAPGTETQPIVISSSPGCWGSPTGCGFTLRDSANSEISNVTLNSAYIR